MSVIGFADQQASGIDQGDPENPDEQTDNGYTSILSGFQGNGDTSSDKVSAQMSATSTTISNAAPSNLASNSTIAPTETPVLEGQTVVPDGTVAFIGTNASVTAGGDVGLRAEEHLTFSGIAGNIAVGGVALGASIVIGTVNGNVEAYIDNGATVMAGSDSGDDILVRARFSEELDGGAYAGQAGGFSLGAQVVVLTENTDVLAYVDQGAKINRAGGTVQIDAFSERDVDAVAAGGAIGGVTIGAAVAVADVGGSVEAFIGDADVGQAGTAVGGLIITATSDVIADAEAYGVQAGIGGAAVNADAAVANVDPTVTAEIMGGAAVNATGDITVQSISEADAEADAIGVAVSSGFALGLSVATATLNPAVTASIGNLAAVTGSNVTVRARSNRGESNEPLEKGARANAVSGAGALLAAASGAVSYAGISTDVSASVGQATISATGGVIISADSYNDADSDASGIAGGAVAIAALTPVAQVSGSTTASLDGIVTNSTGVTVEALGQNIADAKAKVASLSLGGGSGAGAVAEVTEDADVKALVTGNASITSSGAVLVDAELDGEGNKAYAEALGLAGGVFGSGTLMVSYATVAGSVVADVDGKIMSSSQVTVQADGKNKAEAYTLAAAIGGYFGGAGTAAIAEVTDKADVEATVGDTSITTTGALLVKATSDNDAIAQSDAGAGGALGITGSGLSAKVGGGTKAELDADVNNATSVKVEAVGSNNAESEALAIAIGLFSGAGADAYAEVTNQADVEALIGSQAILTVPGATVDVLATGDNNASAVANGGSGGAISISVMLPEAKIANLVKAEFDGVLVDGTTDASRLWVKALGENTASATAKVGQISLLGGAGAQAKATITSEADVEALVGANASIATSGEVLVDARLQGDKNKAFAQALGLSGGILASVAVIRAEATVSGGVTADFDGDVKNASSVTVQAAGANSANGDLSVAGFGAFSYAGARAGATVDTNADVVAWVGSTAEIKSGSLYVSASSDNDALADSDAATGGLISIGLSKPEAKVEGAIQALMDGHITDATQISVEAGSTSNAKAITAICSAGLGAGADATPEATVSSNALTQAQIGTDAEISAPNADIIVHSVANNEALATAETVAAGGVAVNVSDPTAKSNGRSESGLLGSVVGSDGVSSGANTITVFAQGIDASIAQIKSVTGGAIAVGVAEAIANTGSSTAATLGSSGAVIVATGDISVIALGMTDADSSTSSKSGGLVNINEFEAVATSTPTVTTTVGSNTFIKTDGLVSISANHNVMQGLSDGTFRDATVDPLLGGVDDLENSITFTLPHGFMTNNVVTYDALGGNVGGLHDDRQYNVIVLGTKEIQLGATFDSSFIDTVTDEIEFATPHNLQDGDLVYYYAPDGAAGGLGSGTLYEVKKIDEFHVKLLIPGQAKPSVDTSASNIDADSVNNLVSNPFTEGMAVTYRYESMYPVGAFSSMCVNADLDGVDLNINDDGELVENDNDAIIADWNGDGHLDSVPAGLATGTAVIYTASDPTKPIGGLESGTKYYVINYNDGKQIRLADTWEHAMGVQWADPDGNPGSGDEGYIPGPIVYKQLTPGRDADSSVVTHTLTRAGDVPLPDLVDGQTYYVYNSTATSFQLKNAAGNIMNLNPGGLSLGSHHFVVEGIDLTSEGEGMQKLVLDIAPGSGNSKLVAGGGADNFIGAPSGDLVVTASAAGGGGGVIDVKGADASATSSPTVTLSVGSLAEIEANKIEITTDALGSAQGLSKNSGAGLVSVGDANATASIFVTSTITVGTDTVLNATDDILICSKSELDGSSEASTKAKGLGAGVDARAWTYLNYNTSTSIDGELTAGDSLKIEARSLVDGYSKTTADARGLGAAADANVPGTHSDFPQRGVHIGNTMADTVVDIKSNALLTGKTVELNAIVDKYIGQAVSVAYSKAAGTNCDAAASVTADGKSNVLLETGAEITGGTSVLIQSQYLNVNLTADADSHSDAVGGDTDAYANVNVDTIAKVTGRDEAIIRTADLDVDTTQSGTTMYNRSASRDGAWIDTGGTYEDNGEAHFARDIFWESRVIWLGEANPEVVIDSTGKVVKLVGEVTLQDQAGNPYGLGNTFDALDDIIVNDIIYDKGNATADFRANALGDLDGEGTPLGQIWGNNAHFDVQHTWDHVYITNYSDRDLITNLIDVSNLALSGTVTVKVDTIYDANPELANNVSYMNEDDPYLSPPPVVLPVSNPTFEFDVADTFARTEVRIKNLQPGGIAESYVMLDGVIDNPIGITQILNERGDILSDTDADVELIRTNELDLDATGNIGQQAGGTARQPISVEMIKFTDKEFTTWDMALNADAGEDVVLDITAHDRSHALAATSLNVNIDQITAGDDVDLVINDSKVGTDLGPASGRIWVNLYDPPAPNPYHSQPYYAHFRPDEPADSEINEILRAFGISSTDIDSTYNFAEVRAGDDIDIGHISTTGLAVEAEPRSYALTQITLADANNNGVLEVSVVPDPAPAPDKIVNFNINTDAAWTGGNLSASDETPQIFLTTNGNIVANEIAGDMLVGHVHSTAGNVTLSTVSGSVLDALGDTVSDVDGRSIDIDANGGSIGTSSDDLEIDSLRGSPNVGLDVVGDDVGLEAATGIYLTEMDGKLRLVLAHSYTGDIRLTVNESTPDLDEDLELIKSGTAFTAEIDTTQWRTVDKGQIFAEAGSVLLRVGDDVTTHWNSQIIAAQNINIYGDYANLDTGTGTNIHLGGYIVHGPVAGGYLTQIWGNADVDNIKFDPTYIYLGPKTIIYGCDNNDIIDARSVTNTGVIIFGNAGADTIWGSQCDDLILGDNGWVKFGSDLLHVSEVWSDAYSANYGISSVSYSAPVVGPTIYGGNDTICGEGGSDSIIGGVGADKIYGDKPGSTASTDGQDILIGDNGRIRCASTAKTGQFYTFGTPVTSVFTGMDKDVTTGGKDTITGNAKKDLLIGGVGADKITSDSTDIVFTENCSIIFTVGYMTAEGPAPITASTDLLSNAELAPIVAQAKEFWEEALGNNGRVNLLEGVQVSVSDLPGNTLGTAFGSTIVIDANAAGYGWFIDPTPADSIEFINGSAPSGMDLLTVVMHEMGHVLGYSDVYDGSNIIMDGELATGIRYTIPTLTEIGETSLNGGGWAFDVTKGEETRLVTLGADRVAEQLSDMEIKPGKSWLADFLLNRGGKDSNPNKHIAVDI